MSHTQLTLLADANDPSTLRGRADLLASMRNCFAKWSHCVQTLAPKSVSTRISLAVNVLVLVCGIGFLILDYCQEFSHRLADKSAALRRQAMALHLAASRLDPKSPFELQNFVDGICEKMCGAAAPAHYFVVDVAGKTLKPRGDSSATADSLGETRAADTHGTVRLVDQDLLVAKYTEGNITIHVGERMASILADIRQQTIFRSAGVAAFGIVLSVGVNIAIGRLVRQPLCRLVTGIDRIADGDYGRRLGQFEGSELSQVAAAVDSMSRSLGKAEASRKAALNRARRVQKNLLPRIDSTNGLEMAFFHRAAEDVAGDYLDVFQTSRGTTILCVADVAGHGIAPAMIAAILKVLLLDASEVHDNPAQILELLNRKFAEVNLLEDFATLFLAEWRPTTRTLHYVNAGHEPALLVNSNSAPRYLSSTGTVVGIAADMKWQSRTVPIDRGDLLTCWTDGVTEVRDCEDSLLGRERLVEAIQSRAPRTPQEAVDTIDRVVFEHRSGRRPTDDCTALAVRFF